MDVTYPELELTDPRSLLNQLDKEVKASSDWTMLTTPVDGPGVSAGYAGSGFPGRGLKVFVYEDDSSIDPAEPS